MPSGLVSVFVYFAVFSCLLGSGFSYCSPYCSSRAAAFVQNSNLRSFDPLYHLLQSAGCRPVPSCVRKLLVSISGCLSCSSCFADLLWFCSASLSLCRCSRFRFLPSARYCSFVCLAPVFRSHPSTRIRPGFDLMLLSTWHLRQTSFFLRVCY